jgi:hypothetical protein
MREFSFWKRNFWGLSPANSSVNRVDRVGGLTVRKASSLSSWLERRDPLHSFIDLEKRPPNQEFGGFLSFDVVVPAHESLDLEAESLSDSWKKVHEYVADSLEIIGADEPMWLDREEVEMIKNQLGEPPPLCYPIYMITVGDGDAERLVYIGKTSSSNGRFRGGHIALTKLLHPMYDGFTKRVYIGAIYLLADDKSYQPIEWVKPLETAEALLTSIEAQLIFNFKPQLNTQHMNSNNTLWPISLHINNFTDVTTFMHDKNCSPM